MDNAKPSPTRIIGLRELLDRVPYGRVQIWRLERQGRFPRRIRIGPRRIGWLETEIDDWIRSRVNEREQSGNEASGPRLTASDVRIEEDGAEGEAA